MTRTSRDALEGVLADAKAGVPRALNVLADLRAAYAALAAGEVRPAVPGLPTRELAVDVQAVRPGEVAPRGAVAVEHADGCRRWRFELCDCSPVVRRAA